MSVEHFVSASCGGESCGVCYRAGDAPTPATHKVGEEISSDEPMPHRHNFTQYVCCSHFIALFGSAVFCLPAAPPETPKGGE